MNEEFENELIEAEWTFCKRCGGPCPKGEDCARPCVATIVDALNGYSFPNRLIDGSAQTQFRVIEEVRNKCPPEEI